MDLMTRPEIAEYLGLREPDISVLSAYCDNFESITIKAKCYSERSKVEEFKENFDIKEQMRLAYSRKNAVYNKKRYAPRLKERELQNYINAFTGGFYTPWRRFRNREIYAKYLSDEAYVKMLKNSERLGIMKSRQ